MIPFCYVGTHPYAFRAGQPALVVGARIRADGRYLFQVQYADGVRDEKAMKDTQNYRLVAVDSGAWVPVRRSKELIRQAAELKKEARQRRRR